MIKLKKEIDFKKYRKLLNLLLIIPIIMCIVFVSKNIKILKNFYLRYKTEKPEFTFSIFNKTITNDTFFTIAIGEYVLKNGNDNMDHLTWHENLSFPHSGVFDMGIATIYNKFGLNGLVIFETIMMLIIAITVFYIINKKTKEWKIAIPATFAVIYLSRFMFVVRAQIVSYWLLLLEFLFIENLLETNKKRYAILLLIIPIIIANIHSSVFLVYFVLYLPYIAEFLLYKIISKIKIKDDKKSRLGKIKKILLNKFKIEKKENLKTLLIVGFFALFTGFLSTAGTAPYTDMFKAMHGTSTKFIGELAHSTLNNNPVFYYVLLILFVLIQLPKAEVKITDVFFILGFGMMTISTYRCMYYFWLICATPISRIIMSVIKNYNIKIEYKVIKIALVFSLIIVGTVSYGISFFQNQTTEMVPKTVYPVNVCDYILENIDIENMRVFNDFNYGSYMEFRGIPAFIDSRSGMFTEEFNSGVTILNDWLSTKKSKENFEKVIKKYKITHVVTSLTEQQFEYVSKSPGWKLLYTDNTFYLYEKQ